ncbi:unnamed protein product, partial [Brassica rapa subsp. narinosa]
LLPLFLLLPQHLHGFILLLPLNVYLLRSLFSALSSLCVRFCVFYSCFLPWDQLASHTKPPSLDAPLRI